MELENKVVAITGAYSGLGAALSEILAKKGCKLVLGGRNKEKLDEFVSQMSKITEVVGVLVDVTNNADCVKFIEAAEKHFGQLDVLINNAGMMSKLNNIEEVTEDELKESFETNLFGTIYCTKAAVKIMKPQKHGIIINIGSTSAVDLRSNHIAYGTSKYAVIGLTQMLNIELNPLGIKVFCFSPGGTRTKLFRHQPGVKTDTFMDPFEIAGKIAGILENPPEDWHVIVRRQK